MFIFGLSPFGICLSVKLRSFPDSFENRRPKQSLLKTYPCKCPENALYCQLGLVAFFAKRFISIVGTFYKRATWSGVTVPLENPITVYNIDGTLNEAGSITRRAKLNLTVGSYTFKEEFLVTNIGPEDVILGLPWLKKWNLDINWETGDVKFQLRSEATDTPLSGLHQIDANREQRREWLRAAIINDTKDEVWILAGYTYSQAIAVEANRDKYAKTFEELVSKEYHRHKKVFSEEESQRLPKHQPWDHAIDLAPDASPSIKSKVCPMSPIETEELKRFLEDALAKGYVVPSKSPITSPVFFIKKKDGKLRFVQDYRKLNNITVKNRYPLPLAADIINKLQGAKIFTKFNVR
ncbi:polyprotein [Phanerochaete sordida]|uniref:Polyprotein n=1 Tax=Phanerochaete sordida TaxID=48140 RepID=A0A9P3GRV7_9APHY|nr:polyprotein [Phanerochaete sordida]